MPAILLIETATEICSTAISQDGAIIAQKEAEAPYSHGEQLTLQIQTCCKEAGLSLAQLDAVAISAGPGSYTALRIGTATAKGICYARQKPLVAVDTLEAIAVATIAKTQREKALYLPMIDARRMEVYTAIFDGQGQCLEPPHARVISESSFDQYLEQGYSLVLSGNGAEKCLSILPEKGVHFEAIYCRAKNLIPMAEKKLKNNQVESLAYFEPFYLKPPNITTPKKRL
jgi:tRNA threonylcarbamoyladenosine biosynthesis protein TsaB